MSLALSFVLAAAPLVPTLDWARFPEGVTQLHRVRTWVTREGTRHERLRFPQQRAEARPTGRASP